ncbi:MAG TPA: M28 family peptidase [Bacteroidia bacterium]|nr:M28 family peptidase [Bacteroidia bacterium]
MTFRTNKLITSALLVIFYLVYFPGSGVAQDSLSEHYASLITGKAIGSHLEVLTADSLEGRETASPGMEKATRYVAGVFQQLGMPPLANGTYYQRVPLINIIAGWMTIDGRRKHYNEGQDFYSTSGCGSVSFKVSEIVFAGYGIVDSASGWNDYKNVNVDGKIVMLLDGVPKNKNGQELAAPQSKEERIKNCTSYNPRAVLWIKSDFVEKSDRVNRWLASGHIALEDSEGKSEIPLINISPEMANDFLRLNKLDINSYEKKVASKKKPVSVEISDSLYVEGAQPKVSCNNVLGYIEGSDLKNEIVIITAHLDHLGMKNGNIYRGADDDGSGSSSLLAMAAAMTAAKKEGHGPRRSVLFMTFTGEEKGLLGSEYYTNHPVFPLENTVADLNIDMIGRVDTINGPATDYVYIIGSDRTSKDLHNINEQANQYYSQLRLDYRYNDPTERLHLYSRSDHYNFIKKGVPVIFYFTGLHADYHKPTDTMDKIDLDKTARIARLVFHTAWEVANRDKRIDATFTGD